LMRSSSWPTKPTKPTKRHAGLVPASTDPHIPHMQEVRHGRPRHKAGVTKERGF
jgi:hypothetical protein